jgi:hypothetical protein
LSGFYSIVRFSCGKSLVAHSYFHPCNCVKLTCAVIQQLWCWLSSLFLVFWWVVLWLPLLAVVLLSQRRNAVEKTVYE